MADDDHTGRPDASVPAPPIVSGRPAGDGGGASHDALPPLVSRAPEEADDVDEEGSSPFPLDAFFIPEDSDRVPMGMDPDSPRGEHHRSPSARTRSVAAYAPADVAERLEELAARLRARGTSTAVGWAEDSDPLRRALGEALARFLPPQTP